MYNIRAKKNLSQNFIMDPRLLDRIARTAGDLRGKHVIEVGPGPGGITRSILGQGATKCTVIEKDPRFLPSLELLNEASGGRLDIVVGDVLTFNMSGSETTPRPFVIYRPLSVFFCRDPARLLHLFLGRRCPQHPRGR